MPERSAGGPESETGGGASERLAGGKLLLDRPAEAVARLRIANPERRNALDHEILAAIAATLPRLDDGISTRCVVITGTPPLFSAGYDIAEFTEEAFEDEAEALVAHPSRRRWRRSSPIPGRPSPRSTGSASAAASSWR
jgi:hypothetical protein